MANSRMLGAIVSQTLSRLLTILLLTSSIVARGQDSVLVKETCKKITELKNEEDLQTQIHIVSEAITSKLATLMAMDSLPKEKRLKTFYTFQYKFNRELTRRCPSFKYGGSIPIPQHVIDFEDRFSRQEIDSMENVCADLSRSKNIYVYIVTIDDYFPDKNITDFSNRNRDRFARWGQFDKGTVLISVSLKNRELMISTGFISTKYLSDQKCSEINKVILPFFREGKYFNGLINGLTEIKKSL